MAVILQAVDVQYAYENDVPVLHAVSLDVDAHSITYLLGHNGCGKTTLMEVIGGVRKPQAGIVRLDGQDVHAMPAAKRAQRIGLVPQMHTPIFAYTVRQVVLMGRTPHLRPLGAPDRHDYAIADDVIALVGLTNLADRPYTELSGGEQQLTLVARGLAQETDVLLLDEPTAHLDPRNQRLVLETVSRLAKERVSFVISSHDPNSAILYADQVVVMKAGRVVAHGTPQAVLTAETLSASYDIPMTLIGSDGGARAVIPQR